MKFGYCHSLFNPYACFSIWYYFFEHFEIMEILSYTFSVSVLSQDASLIECTKKNDLLGIKVAVSRGADINATDSVSFIIITLNFTY